MQQGRGYALTGRMSGRSRMSHRDARRQPASAAAHRQARLPPGSALTHSALCHVTVRTSSHENSTVSPDEVNNDWIYLWWILITKRRHMDTVSVSQCESPHSHVQVHLDLSARPPWTDKSVFESPTSHGSAPPVRSCRWGHVHTDRRRATETKWAMLINKCVCVCVGQRERERVCRLLFLEFEKTSWVDFCVLKKTPTETTFCTVTPRRDACAWNASCRTRPPSQSRTRTWEQPAESCLRTWDSKSVTGAIEGSAGFIFTGQPDMDCGHCYIWMMVHVTFSGNCWPVSLTGWLSQGHRGGLPLNQMKSSEELWTCSRKRQQCCFLNKVWREFHHLSAIMWRSNPLSSTCKI